MVEDPYMALREIFDEVHKLIANDNQELNESNIDTLLLAKFNDEEKSSY